MYTKDIVTKFKVVGTREKVRSNRVGCLYSILLIFVLNLFSIPAQAQCAMCRAALTSNENATQAAAVNDGIVYLMVIPYLLVAGIGYAIYRMKKKKSS